MFAVYGIHHTLTMNRFKTMCQYFYQKGNIGVALKACYTKEFTLFRENFKKNNKTFPYIKPNQAVIGYVSKGNSIIGLIAYSYSENLETYRKAKCENYIKHSHILILKFCQNTGVLA